MHTLTRRRRRTAGVLLVPVLGLGMAFSLTGCGSDDAAGTTAAATKAAATTSAPAASASATGKPAAAIRITDAWAKAAESGPTAVFGTLVNDSDSAVRIVSATTSVSPVMELHEVAANDKGEMVMQPKKGGFLVPASGRHELRPGADHLMIMKVTGPLEPGDDVSVTLTAQDGSTFAFTAPVRSFSGANENYDDNGGGSMMGGESGDTGSSGGDS